MTAMTAASIATVDRLLTRAVMLTATDPDDPSVEHIQDAALLAMTLGGQYPSASDADPTHEALDATGCVAAALAEVQSWTGFLPIDAHDLRLTLADAHRARRRDGTT